MRTVSLLSLTLMLPMAIRAQTVSPDLGGVVLIGTKVRVLAPGIAPEPITRKVAAMQSGVIVLEPDARGGTYVTVPIAEIERLEVHRGNRGAAVGGVVGGAMGATAGYLLASAVTKEEACTEGSDCFDDLGERMVGAAFLTVAAVGGGALAGWGIGSAIGGAIVPDTWQLVPTDRIRIGIVPRRSGGITVGISAAF